MIDLGLSKLALIGVVALVVIGPERLPKVARMAGSLVGRAQRYINELKSEVSREIELEELRKIKQNVQDAATDLEQTIAQDAAQIESTFQTEWDNPPVWNAPSAEAWIMKSKNFRKKKLVHTSAIPSWYKRRNIHKTRVISGAARVARHRVAGTTRTKSAFFL